MEGVVISVVIGALETIPKVLVNGLVDLEIGEQVETTQPYIIIKIGQSTEKCPGDVRRLAVAQNPVTNNQLTLKTLKGIIIIINTR